MKELREGGGFTAFYRRILWFLIRRKRRLRSKRSLSKTRSRLRRDRLKMRSVNELLRRGPRPSQRPSRASWQLTNLPHFLSKPRPNTRRLRPWPNASEAIPITSSRTKAAAPISFLEIGSFIKVPPISYHSTKVDGPSSTFCRLGYYDSVSIRLPR